MNYFVLQVFCSIFSGFMLAAAISNEVLAFGSPLLALFCLAPLYTAFYGSRSASRAALIFSVQILTTHLISSFWLANFHGFAVFTLGASAFGTALEGWMCGFVAYSMPLLTERRLGSRETADMMESAGLRPFSAAGRILWFTASWIFYEWIKSTGAMGYPWGTVSMAAYRWLVFRQIADVTGVWGVSAIYVLVSCVTAEAVALIGSKPSDTHSMEGYGARCMAVRQCARLTLALFAVSGLYGLAQVLAPRMPVKHMNIVLVQQNSDPWESGENDSIRISKSITEGAVAAMRESGMEPDLVLWSEGILDRAFPGSRTYYEHNPGDEGLGEFIKRMGIPFVIGGSTRVNPEKKHTSNSAILFDKNGKYSGFYSKIHLVPFAEVIPYGENPLMRMFMSRVVGFSSGWTPGNQLVLFKVPLSGASSYTAPLEYNRPLYDEIALSEKGLSSSKDTERFITSGQENPDAFVRFSVPICFEDAFNDVCRRLYNMGSEVFLNITNDSWSLTPSSEYQHYIAASYRAIEYRTTLVRCANSGYSVVVDPAGRVLADLDVFTEGSLCYNVPVYKRARTIYARSGDWLAYCALSCIALCMLMAFCNVHGIRIPRIKKIQIIVTAAAPRTGNVIGGE